MAERTEHAPDETQPTATRGTGYRVAVGCGARTIILTAWLLIGATVIVIAWNVAIAPLAGMPRMTFVQAVALVVLVELIAHLFAAPLKQGNDSA